MPPGFRKSDSKYSCANCQYFNLEYCTLYDILVKQNDMCDMWMPQFNYGYKVPKKYAHINFTPPKSVQDAAKRALDWRSKYGRGGTSIGIARARDLANAKNISPNTIKRMVSFFARHGNNHAKHFELQNGKPTPWRIAWDLWGGDPGNTWSNKIKRQMESADKKRGQLKRLSPI